MPFHIDAICNLLNQRGDWISLLILNYPKEGLIISVRLPEFRVLTTPIAPDNVIDLLLGRRAY